MSLPMIRSFCLWQLQKIRGSDCFAVYLTKVYSVVPEMVQEQLIEYSNAYSPVDDWEEEHWEDESEVEGW